MQGRIFHVTVDGDNKNNSQREIFRNKVTEGQKKVGSGSNHCEAYEGRERNVSKSKKCIGLLVREIQLLTVCVPNKLTK